MEEMHNAFKGFNVNAPEFVPGLNINASTFIPKQTFAPPVVVHAPVFVPEPVVATKMEVEPVAVEPVVAAKNHSLAETWEDDLTELPKEEKIVPPLKIEEMEINDKAPKVIPKPKPTIAEEPIVKKTFEIEEIFMDPNRKESVNLVFIGHVDAGKSTIGGHLLYLSGMVDKRTLEKYEREAKEKNRESWYLSWALDTNQEERDKGKTVECGRAFFETEKKHFTLLDAPGHKSFVPNMISGAAQADLALLVISARRGEFETGFEKGGQTREHAMLVKTAGTKRLIVLINKMDDPTVEWSYERYKECVDKLTPYLKASGFNPKTDIHFMPCSGFTGAWLKDPVGEDICPWYRGPPLLTYLDDLPTFQRANRAPLRLPIADRYKDMGTFVIGKIESGGLVKGQSLFLMPNRQVVEVAQVLSDDKEVENASAGDNVKVKLKNVEEEDISSGFVLCNPQSPCQVGSTFDAQVVILEYKTIICAGYTAVLHLHCCVEEVTLDKIHFTLDKKTNKKKQLHPRFIKQDDVAVVRFQVNGGSICMETFKDYPQMGRFTLRDEGHSIGMGKILKVLPQNVEINNAPAAVEQQ